MVNRQGSHFSLDLVSVLCLYLLDKATPHLPSSSLFPSVIAEEDIESVEEGVFDVHL